jgi:peptidoglycan/xylan/chitin deacetylase (PgdA/CDA1 family)
MNQIFYLLKPLIPRQFQLYVRRLVIENKISSYEHKWPIDPASATPPPGWKGWQDDKQFSFVLTHDVELQIGHDRVIELMKMEKELGFVSSYTFVPERYNVSPSVREELETNGFEVGVHGLKHDGKLYSSREVFIDRARKINEYIAEWNAKGFRSPAMHHNLDWISDLDIEYDASTFDTDPFEPQSDGMCTIFPFWVQGKRGRSGYVELPYTLPQDFTLFILMRHKNNDLWKRKLDWIAEKGGMALVNVHPDYLYMGKGQRRNEEFPLDIYISFLEYVKETYGNKYWHALPKEVASYYKKNMVNDISPKNDKISKEITNEVLK